MKVVKKMLAGMLSLSLMCSMGLAMTASAEPSLSEEPLEDPSFEAGDILDSDYWYPHDSCEMETVTKSDAADGDSYVRITHRSSTYDTPTQDVTEAIRENGPGKYYMRCKVKFDDSDPIPDGYPMNFSIVLTLQCSDMSFGVQGKTWFSCVPEESMIPVDSRTEWVTVEGYVDVFWEKTLVNVEFSPYSRTKNTEEHQMNEAYTFVMDDCSLKKVTEGTENPPESSDPASEDPSSEPDTPNTSSDGDESTTPTTKAPDSADSDSSADRSSDADTDTDANQKENGAWWWWIVVVVIVVLAAAGVAVYFFVLKKKKND